MDEPDTPSCHSSGPPGMGPNPRRRERTKNGAPFPYQKLLPFRAENQTRSSRCKRGAQIIDCRKHARKWHLGHVPLLDLHYPVSELVWIPPLPIFLGREEGWGSILNQLLFFMMTSKNTISTGIALSSPHQIKIYSPPKVHFNTMYFVAHVNHVSKVPCALDRSRNDHFISLLLVHLLALPVPYWEQYS